jgi:hypothetical protein
VAAAPTVPALAAGVAAFLAVRGQEQHWQLGARYVGLFNGPWANLRMLPDWIIDLFPGHADEVVATLLLAAWLTLFTLGRRASAPAPTEPSGRFRLELALALVTLAYFALPRSLVQPFYWYAINRRLAVVVALFAALAIRGRIERLRAAILFFAVGGAALWFPIDVARHFHRFNVRMREFDAALAAAPPRAQVLTLIENLRDPEVNLGVFNQWSTWVQLRQGGYQPFNLDQDFPIVARAKLPAPAWDRPHDFHLRDQGEAWDYFLVYGNVFDPFADAPGRVRLAKRAGEWSLWEKLPAPPVDEPVRDP